MKRLDLAVIAFIAFLAFTATGVNAQGCTTQYGGGVTCPPTDLTINKEVKNPIGNVFVENLSTTDATFSPGSEVHFKLTIKNASGQTFTTVTVKDIFPNFLEFEAGPGTYDKATRTLTFTLDNLIAGESRTVEILAKVSDTGAFPTGRNFFCVVNSARVWALNRSDEDTSQLCIQTQVLGAAVLPVAGFNNWLIMLPFLSLGAIGVLLARKAI